MLKDKTLLMEQEKALDEFKVYEKSLEKCNFDVWKLKDLNRNYKITLTEERYEKLGRKNFPKKPTTVEESEITARQLACYISGLGFFKDRIEKNYTYIGYVMTKLTCTNPTNELKIVRKFKYEKL